MKKILTLLLITIILTGCGTKSAKNTVENYLKKYRNLDSEVLVDLENIIENEDLTKDEEEIYRSALKKQYKDLAYEIIEEEYVDDTTYITLKVTDYDFYKAQTDAYIYLENNQEDFNDNNGVYDIHKYTEYKLNKMKNTTERITYNITFTVVKEDDEYIIYQPTENDLMKIHGIYNYDID